MFESFVVNFVSSLFYDVGKSFLQNWSDKKVKALRKIYTNSLELACHQYSETHAIQDILSLQLEFERLIKVSSANDYLLDFALFEVYDLGLGELKKICDDNSIDFDKIQPLLLPFLTELKHEIRLAVEDTENPLFRTAILYGQERIEHKIEALGTEVRDQGGDLAEIKNMLASFPFANEQLRKLQTLVSHEFAQRLNLIQRDWNLGRVDEVLSFLREFRNDDFKWQNIDVIVQAQLLRTEAVFLLQITNRIEEAKTLIHQAKQISPKQIEDEYIFALVVFAEKDYQRALILCEEGRTEEELHLKALTLISLQQYDDAVAVLDEIKDPENIHIQFTKARLALLRHDLDTAVTAVRSAIKMAPHSEEMRFWLAQLLYMSALSPAIQPTEFQQLPEPTLRILYRNAPKYQAALKEAAESFFHLSKNGKQAIRSVAQIWHFACILNLPYEQEAIEKYCQQLLDENSYRELVMGWAISRELNITYDSAVQAINQKIVEGIANPNHVISLVNYYLHYARAEDAVNLLLSNQQLFKDNQVELWLDGLVQSYISVGQTEEAGKLLDQLTDHRRRRQLLFAMLTLDKSEADLEAFLEEDFSEDAILLLNLCEFMAQRGRWDWVSRFSNTIVEAIDTSFAFNLAIQATHRHREIERCLQITDMIAKHYSPDPLPWAYRDMRVRCLIDLGHLKQAYPEAKSSYENSPNKDTFITLVELYELVGDLESIAILARDVLESINLPILYILKIAQLTSFKNRELAIALWRRTMQEEMPDDAVVFALMLANALGLKSETKPLFVQMNKMIHSGHTSVKAVDLNEVIEIQKDRRDFQASVNDTYKKGESPIHIAASIIHYPLVELYHRHLSYSEEIATYSPNSALMAVHGGRPLLSEFPIKEMKGKLAFDITSILLAEHFQILDYLESAFSPLILPQRFVLTLTEMMLRYHEVDQKNVEACREIVQLAERGRLTVVPISSLPDAKVSLIEQIGEEWAKQYSFVTQNEGYFVNFLPVVKRGLDFEPADLPEESSRYLVDARSILDALREHSEITQTEYDQIIDSLGNTARSGTKLAPRPGAKIMFFANTLEHIAGHNFLRKAAQFFEVVITEQQLQDARTIANGEGEIHQLTIWLSRLTHRLFRGIMDGKYQLLPLYHPQEDSDNETLTNDLSVNLLNSLIEQHQDEGEIIVVDDRFCNAALQNRKARILTTVDLLRALTEGEILNREGYYQILMRFRQANIRYILYGVDEILFNLSRNFQKENLTVRSSRQLDTMREYIYACVSQADLLQLIPPDTSFSPAGERRYLEDTCRYILYSIYEFWIKQPYPQLSCVLSGWIIDNLYAPCRDIFIEHGILNIPASDSRPFPELFEFATNFSDNADERAFSKQELFRIWLWYQYSEPMESSSQKSETG